VVHGAALETILLSSQCFHTQIRVFSFLPYKAFCAQTTVFCCPVIWWQLAEPPAVTTIIGSDAAAPSVYKLRLTASNLVSER